MNGMEEQFEIAEKIRERNFRILDLYSRYLERPDRISEKIVKDTAREYGLPEDIAFCVLFCAVCGLDEREDKILINEYVRPYLKPLDADIYKNDPYYCNIHIPAARMGKWELKYGKYAPYELFPQDEPDCKGLKEAPRLGYFTEPFSFPAVAEEGREWMSITPNEINTMRQAIGEVRGNVLTFGLGLGYFAYMAARKEEVKKVTVVEREHSVISLFEKYILPQFGCGGKIEIVCADAFDYAEKECPKKDFNFAFTDIWHDPSDGISLYKRMKKAEKYSPDTKFLYWIEKTLLSYIRWELFRNIREMRGMSEIKGNLQEILSDENIRRSLSGR